ncbi:MAG: trigger factor [Clostridia bacterium]|nr:trigger factor [Clostridia bacterium]
MNKFDSRAIRRMLAGVVALAIAAASFAGCGKTADNDNVPALDPDNPNLIAGEEKITSDPFVYWEEDLTDYVKLGNYRDIPVTRISSVLTEAEFEEQIQVLLEYYAEPTKITDRAAAEGDTCNFDYSGSIDGVQFDGGTATGQSITLTGNGGFIEGFVPAIIGKKPGESFDIVTTFPADYGVESLNGKEAVFKCTLNYIEGEAVLPAFDDEFAKSISEFSTAAELKADIRASLEEEKIAQAENQLYSDVWTQVVANAEILKYPEEKVTFIYQQYVQEYGSYAAMAYGITYEEYLDRMGGSDEQIRQMARDQVKEDLIFYAITVAEQITVTDEEYQAELPVFAEAFGMEAEAMVEQYGEAAIRDGILWNKTQDLLVSWAKVTDAN